MRSLRQPVIIVEVVVRGCGAGWNRPPAFGGEFPDRIERMDARLLAKLDVVALEAISTSRLIGWPVRRANAWASL